MMIKHRFIFGLMIALVLAVTEGAVGQQQNTGQVESVPGQPRTTGQNGKASATDTKYVSVHKYDPARNAELDLKDALAEASRTGKRILVKVGGEWCSWCHIMDAFFEKHSELLSLAEQNYVILKINYSEENPNAKLLSRYPAIEGYPHLFILDQEGKLLRSQETGQLEEGKSYSLGKFMTFLKEWSPSKEKASMPHTSLP